MVSQYQSIIFLPKKSHGNKGTESTHKVMVFKRLLKLKKAFFK